MRRALQLLARLYPAEWRARYGAEYAALLEEREPRWRDAVNVAWVAVKLWMRSWSFVRVVLPCALAGVLVAVAISFGIPPRYTWQTVTMIVTTNQSASGLADGLEKIYLDRDMLASVIQKFDLYPSERSHMPLNAVIDKMQRHIRLRRTPVTWDIDPNIYERMVRDSPGKVEKLDLVVQFDYPDPQIAQKVEEVLVSRAMSFNLQRAKERPDSRAVFTISHMKEPDGLSRKEFGAIGLISGLWGGLLLAAAIRWRRRVTVAAG